MSVEIIESVTAAAFGAADAYIAAKVTRTLPGNLPMSVGFEAAGAVAGMFGKHIGLGPEIRDSLLISSMTLIGSRAAKLAMAGKLLTPQQWGSVGGDGGDSGGDGSSDYSLGGGQPIALGAARAYGGPRGAGVRMLGRGSSFGLYPGTSETAGVAG